MRDAKKNGEDVVEALYEDATELAAILQALSVRGKSGVVLSEEESEVGNE